MSSPLVTKIFGVIRVALSKGTEQCLDLEIFASPLLNVCGTTK